MKKSFLFTFLCIVSFSCKVVKLEEKKGTLKIKKNDYTILVVPIKYFHSGNIKKISSDSTSKIRLGKANDINFIIHNLKSLRESGALKKDMYILQPYKNSSRFIMINPVSSNPMITRQDSLDPFGSKKLKSFFILRKYN